MDTILEPEDIKNEIIQIMSRPSKKSRALRGELETPNLLWTHYYLLTRVNCPETKSFYEIEAVKTISLQEY